jgi:hypothetical protein
VRTFRLALAAVALLAAGFAAGYLYRRAYRPTLEEKVQDAGKDLHRAEEKVQDAGKDLHRAWDKVTK